MPIRSATLSINPVHFADGVAEMTLTLSP